MVGFCGRVMGSWLTTMVVACPETWWAEVRTRRSLGLEFSQGALGYNIFSNYLR